MAVENSVGEIREPVAQADLPAFFGDLLVPRVMKVTVNKKADLRVEQQFYSGMNSQPLADHILFVLIAVVICHGSFPAPA